MEKDPVEDFCETMRIIEAEGAAAYRAHVAEGIVPVNPYSDSRQEMWSEGFATEKWMALGKPTLSSEDDEAAYDAGVKAYHDDCRDGTNIANPYSVNNLDDVFAQDKSEIWSCAYYDERARCGGDDFVVLGTPTPITITKNADGSVTHSIPARVISD